MQAYIPAMVAVIFGIIFLVWPILAAILVAGGLFLFAFLYSSVVYRFLNLSERIKKEGAEVPGEFREWREPNFRNVTVYMKDRHGRIFWS